MAATSRVPTEESDAAILDDYLAGEIVLDDPHITRDTLKTSRHALSIEVTPEEVLARADYPEGYAPPWDRVESETDLQWEYFRTYRNMGTTRTYKSLGAKYGISHGAFSYPAKKNNWRKRIIAWDRQVDLIFRAKLQDSITEMAVRHADTLVEGINVLAAPFRALTKRLTENDSFMEELSDLQARKLFELALRAGKAIPSLMSAERLSRGMPTEIIQTEGEVRHVHEVRDPDHIAEILSILERNHAFPGNRESLGTGKVIDAEDFQVHDDDAVRAEDESETDRILTAQ